MSDEIRFTCPNCKKMLAVASDKAGQQKTCPSCGVRLQVPSAETVRTMKAGTASATMSASLGAPPAADSLPRSNPHPVPTPPVPSPDDTVPFFEAGAMKQAFVQASRSILRLLSIACLGLILLTLLFHRLFLSASSSAAGAIGFFGFCLDLSLLVLAVATYVIGCKGLVERKDYMGLVCIGAGVVALLVAVAGLAFWLTIQYVGEVIGRAVDPRNFPPPKY